MVEAAYFSKKLGRPILPDLVAINKKPAAVDSAANARIVNDADRKRRPVRQ
jgi:hypothetical protein